MKKTYMTPATTVATIATEALIAESYGLYSDEKVNSAEILVKTQPRSNYSVWEDDWSAGE